MSFTSFLLGHHAEKHFPPEDGAHSDRHVIEPLTNLFLHLLQRTRPPPTSNCRVECSLLRRRGDEEKKETSGCVQGGKKRCGVKL